MLPQPFRGARGGGRREARPLPRVAARLPRRGRAGRAGRGARRRPRRARRATGSRAASGSSFAEPPERASQPSRGAGRRASPGRTSTSPSSTSPPASSSIRAPGTAAARSSTRSPERSPAASPERPGIVHRLDRDTSGLLVVARSRGGHERLSALVRRRALERTYLALVRGTPGVAQRPDRGADRPRPRRPDPLLARHRHAARRGHALRGRRARGDDHALLSVRLETGRMHQIRVHLAAIGLPVVGDPVYGVREPRARAAVPARRAPRVPASVHGRVHRGRVAAPARPRGVPRRAGR